VLYGTLSNKNGGVDPDRLMRVRLVVRADSSDRGNKVGAREAVRGGAISWKARSGSLNNIRPDSGRSRSLTQKVEPTRDPRCEGSTLRLGNHGRPEIWAATGWMGAANL
jgi:hypothetical protein